MKTFHEQNIWTEGRRFKRDNSCEFLHREKEELQNTSFIHNLQIHVEELKNEIDELKESNECKQMQLDIMNVSKCNLCEETGKIKQDKLLLISMYEKIFKENYHLRKRYLRINQNLKNILK